MPSQIALPRLAVDLLRLRGELGLAVFVGLDDRTTLGQVIGKPFLLRPEKRLDIRGVAAVLVGGCKQVLNPGDAVSLCQIVTEACMLGKHPGRCQGAGDLPPRHLRVLLLRLVLLPDLGLVVLAGGGDGAQLLLVRHIAARHLVEHGGQVEERSPSCISTPSSR
jgi:hypothetical protein